MRRVDVVLTWLGSRWLEIDELFALDGAARPLPALDLVAGQVRGALFGLPVLALVAHMVRRWLGLRWAAGVLAAALVLFAGEGARSLPEFGIGLLSGGIEAAVFLFAFAWLFRGNDLAYVLAFVGGRALAAVAPWFTQKAPGAMQTGAIAAGLMIALLAWVVWRAGRGNRRSPEAAALAPVTSPAEP
jgi:hypothetical protein